MQPFGNTTHKILSKEESWSINEGYEGGAAMPEGTIVKFDAVAGQMVPVAATTDKPFGITSTACKGAGERVTVHSQFVAVARAKASGTVAVGDQLAAKQIDGGAEKLTQYKKAVTGDYVAAEALVGNTTGNDIWVGVYRVFVKI